MSDHKCPKKRRKKALWEVGPRQRKRRIQACSSTGINQSTINLCCAPTTEVPKGSDTEVINLFGQDKAQDDSQVNGGEYKEVEISDHLQVTCAEDEKVEMSNDLQADGGEYNEVEMSDNSQVYGAEYEEVNTYDHFLVNDADYEEIRAASDDLQANDEKFEEDEVFKVSQVNNAVSVEVDGYEALEVTQANNGVYEEIEAFEVAQANNAVYEEIEAFEVSQGDHLQPDRVEYVTPWDAVQFIRGIPQGIPHRRRGARGRRRFDENSTFGRVSKELKKVAKKHKSLSLNALSDICKLIEGNVPGMKGFPRDGRSIMGTPRDLEVQNMPPGTFYYFGIVDSLKEILDNVPSNEIPNRIKLGIGIDGVPLYEKSAMAAWPIMGCATNLPNFEDYVFPIALYCGEEKPDVNEFLSLFVEESNTLVDKIIRINNRDTMIDVSLFVMDAPAKSWVTGVIGHNGYNSCTRCKVVGVYINNRMSFYDLSANERTNDEYLGVANPKFQPNTTHIINLKKFDFKKMVPLDYMHVVLLGIVKKVLRKFWIKGADKKKKGKLSAKQQLDISKRLKECKRFKPREFNRFARGLNHSAFWKATEFRCFLMILGVIVLKGILPTVAFNHFRLLHVAMHFLLKRNLCSEPNITKAEELLIKYIRRFSVLYGRCFVSHNVHALCHLADEARRHGPLDNSSAFIYENHLKLYPDLCRKRFQETQQVARRLIEYGHKEVNRRSSDCKWRCLKSHTSGPLTLNCGNPQFEILVRDKDNLTLCKKGTAKDPQKISDSCCALTDGKVVIIENIATDLRGQGVIVGKCFRTKTNLYKKPFPSSDLGIWEVSSLSETQENWRVDDIAFKYVIVPTFTKRTTEVTKKFAIFPMSHMYQS